jgi:hypothetical protein
MQTKLSQSRGAREVAESRLPAVIVGPAGGELGRETHESMALTDVRFVADYGLKSELAGGPLSAADIAPLDLNR